MDSVKGTFDFYPAEKYAKEAVLDTLRQVAERAGFLWVETPALETVKLLTRKSGEEVKNQIFLIEQRGSEQFGLRFDMTVPLTRMFMKKQKEIPKPVKWCYTTRMWRYEAPQRGRLREFYQYGVEMFGAQTAASDAEIIQLLLSSLFALGIKEKDIVLKINNRKLVQGLLFDLVPKEIMNDVLRIIDRSPKTTEEDVIQQLEKVGVKKVKEVMRILSLRGKPKEVIKDLQSYPLNTLAQEGLHEINAVVELVSSPCLVIDVSTVRGLAYYTGLVFECFDKEGKYRALAGGGRYDDLVQLLGGESTSAIGFAIGYATLSLLLNDLNLCLTKLKIPKYYIAVVDEKVRKYARTIAEQLRKIDVVEMDIMARKVGKQVEYANLLGIPYVIFIGPDEMKQKKVKLRDMKTGKEKMVNVEYLLKSKDY